MVDEATRALDEALDQTLQTARPEVAEVLLACAVPHGFDVAMIAALRGIPDHADKILARLTRFTFVEAIGPEQFTLHDNVRARLLARLVADPSRLQTLHARAGAEIQRRLTIQPDDALSREAVYHQLAADPPRGLREAEAFFDTAEADHRLEACELLTALLREQGLDTWAAYYDARLAMANHQFEAVSGALTALLAGPAPEADLAARARLILGRAEVRLGHWLAAIEHFQQSLQHFQKAGDIQHAGAAMLETANAYADFAQNVRPALRRRHFSPWLTRLTRSSLGQALAPHGFVLAQVFWFLVFFPISVYLLWQSPRRSLLYLPRPRYTQAIDDLPTVRLVGRALGWYRRASQTITAEAGQAEIKARWARLLRDYNNPRGAARLYDELAQSPSVRASPFRAALVQRELGRLAMIVGDVAHAMPLLAASLAVFRRYGDRLEMAETLALHGMGTLLTHGPQAALEDYQQSVALYRALKARLALGELMEDIDVLQNWRFVPDRDALGRPLLDALGLGDADRVFLTHQLLPLRQTLGGVVGASAFLGLLGALWALGEAFGIDSAAGYLLVYPVGLLVGLPPGWLIASALAIRFIPLNVLEARQPAFLAPDDDQLASVRFDGRVECVIRWRDITAVLSQEIAVWRTPDPASASLKLVSGSEEAIHIQAWLTTRYQALRSEIQRHLRGRPDVLWREEHTSLLRSPRGLALVVIGVLGSALLSILGGVLTFLLTSRPGSLGFGLSSLAGGTAVVLLVPLTWWGLGLLARIHAMHPERPIPFLVMVAGGLVLAGYFGVPVVQWVGRPFSLVLVGLAFWWIAWAGLRLLWPSFLVPVREPGSRWIRRIQALLTVGALVAAGALAIRFVAIDVQAYILLARGVVTSLGSTSPELALESEQIISQVIRLTPNDPWAYLWRAYARYNANQPQGVVEDATLGLKLVDDSVYLVGNLLYFRAGAYLELEDYEAALADYRAIDTVGQGSAQNFQIVPREARTLIRLGREAEAQALLEAWSLRAYDYLDRGQLYFRVGAYTQALADFEQADSIANQARALEALGRRDEALKAAAQINADGQRGMVYLQIHEFTLAEPNLQAAAAWESLARLYHAQGRYQEARDAAEKAIGSSSSITRSNALAHALRALASAQLGNAAPSLAIVNQALDVTPRCTGTAVACTRLRLRYVRAQFYVLLGEPQPAIADLEWVLREWEYLDLALWEVRDAQQLLAELQGQ